MGHAWRVVMAIVLLTGLAVLTPSSPVQAAGVVGNGTPGSCTEGALDTALTGGGSVIFDCGPNPVTIELTDDKVVTTDTQIDGGGLITLDGQGQTRIFTVVAEISLNLTGITLTGGNGAGDLSSGNGGAIYNDAGTVTLTNSTVSGNMASGNGGGINAFLGTLTLTNSTVSNNTANGGGGRIFNNGGTVTITTSTLNGNTAGSGGGIYNVGDVALTSSTLSSNAADVNGGGLLNFNATATLINSTLSGNEADDSGGGIYNDSDSTLSGSGVGGGIFNGGTVALTNSTVSGNSAEDEGGGILNATIVTLQNTIVANSTNGNCAGIPVTSQDGNLSDDASCALGGTNDLDDTEDGLGALADNGGPTQAHLPQAGSNAIDNALKAACPATDQRGISRPQSDGCDIGAVEVEVGQGATYTLCASIYTGAVTSPLNDDCGPGMIELDIPGNLSFCIYSATRQVTYSFGLPCPPPRWTHTTPDDGDLLTCLNVVTRVHTWMLDHSQCTVYELPNTIPATL